MMMMKDIEKKEKAGGNKLLERDGNEREREGENK